jgi:hypothetical protein
MRDSRKERAVAESRLARKLKKRLVRRRNKKQPQDRVRPWLSGAFLQKLPLCRIGDSSLESNDQNSGVGHVQDLNANGKHNNFKL